nr:putative transposase (putative), gypsy type [Tanacetum cinerariifolium]
MSAITDIRCVLTQKALDALCDKFHIPREVHLILPNQNDTMHERPSGKIGLYTRFFDYANFRLPLFTFLVDVLRHTAKHVTRDPDPAAADFNAQDYTTLDANIVVEDAAPVQARRQRKRKSVVVDAGGVFHHPKKLRKDHGTPSGASVGGKSQSMLQRLLAGAVLNAEVRVAAIPTLPFCDSFYSSHHSGTKVAKAEVDSLIKSFVEIMTTVTTTTSTVDPTLATKKKFIKPSLFGAGSSFAGGIDPITGVFSNLTSSNFLVGAIHTVINPDTDLQKVYVPQWSVMNGYRLDDGHVCRKMVDEFAPLKFFTSVCEMEHDQLFTEFNARAARQMSISAKVRMRAEYNVNEKRSTAKEAKAAEAIRLRAEASNFETMEKSLRDETNALRERNVVLEKERNALDVKVTEHETSLVSKEHELTDLNALVKSVKSQNDNLAERRFLRTPREGHDIGKAIEKGMQDGLSAGITHGKKARSNKVASIEAVMNILCLEGHLVEKLGLDELQPNVDQLMVPIHHSPDKVVIGAITLSLALDVSNIHIWKIKENIANQRSALHDVFVHLSELLSIVVLTCTKGTSDVMFATGGATTTLSTTFASANIIAHIYVNDYKVIDEEDQAAADGNTASFPNVDDVELNIVQ